VAELPSGAVTFLFTDIEGSTRLLKQLRGRYGEVLAGHQRLLREAFDRHGGRVIDTQGDSFFVVFGSARAAVLAAVQAQRALADHDWPEEVDVRVRIGVHTGQAEASEESYVGLSVHRAARISAAGHGGQILVSQTAHNLLEDEEEELGVELRDLGEQQLKDLDRPVRLYQVVADGLQTAFPPLRTEAPSPAAEPASRYPRRRTILIGALAGVIAAAVAIPIFALGGGSPGADLVDVTGNSIGLVDARSGTIEGAIEAPGAPSALAAGFGYIWVASADSNSVYAIDPSTKTPRDTIVVENAPAGVAAGAGSVWVTNSLSGTVSRISPETFGVVQTISVGNGPTGIAVGGGRVWVANTGDHTVSVISAGEGKLLHTYPVGSEPGAIVVGEGAVWVASNSWGEVVKLNPASGEILDRIHVGDGPSALAAGHGSVWVANSLSGTVSQIDSRTNDITSTIDIGSSVDGLTIVGDEVWVAAEAAGTLTRIAADGKRTLRIGNRPTAAVASGDVVYVALRAGGAAHRGGTLTYAVPALGPPMTIDPANAYQVELWQAMALAHDGLLTYRHVAGQEGVQLVPDLALSMPSVSEDGKTYTFQVRSGIHYSDGRLFKASDVRSSFERVFTLRPRREPIVVDYFHAIRGAGRCTKLQCDLSSGIVGDDEAHTVTFHLAAADPDFLVKLASTFASIVPRGTPPVTAVEHGLPATGPYRIVRLVKDRSVLLARNPRFRQWSSAAQPNGFADKIVLRATGSPERRISLVTAGKADLASSSPPQRFPVPPSYAAQLHLYALPGTIFLVLDSSRPPFDDVRVRRAVNYALDRNKADQLLPAGELRRPTCQVLPPSFPGYRQYCPYTLDPVEGGAWSAPNVSKALQLVKASRTAGTRVTLWFPRPVGARLGRYIVRVLNSLGYRANVRFFPDVTAYFGILVRAKRPPQIAFSAWAADYPAASNFIEELFGCSAPFNLGRFCDPALDRGIHRALRLQRSDPAGANALWAELDRRLIDQAAAVPLFNLYGADFVSKRVGNYQYNPAIGVLLDQLWVR
jgi:peptide/nickel transport system substrate-binding protein